MARKDAEKVALDMIGELTGNHQITLDAYKEMFKRMSNKEFEEWIDGLRKGKLPHIYAPHGKHRLKPKLKQVFKFLKKYGAPVRQRLTYKYKDGRVITSEVPHLVFLMGARRTVQSFVKQVSVAKDPLKKIDYLTGQVSGDSRASRISLPETSVLTYTGLHKTALELNKARGGDIGAMLKLDSELFNKGSVNFNELAETSTGVISKDVLQIYAAGAMVKIKI